MKRKTKQTLFLVFVAVFVIGVILFFVFRDKKNSSSSHYQENERKDIVEYGGKKYRYNEHLSNYVFIGVDTREPVTEYETNKEIGRADAIFLLSYDRVKKTVRCVSIPRDTMTNVRMIAPDGTDMGTSIEHINMQYVFGDGKEESCRLMKETISELFYGIPIQGYLSLNMDGIAVAVDVLGNVEMVLADNSLEDVNSEYVQGAKIIVTKDNAEQIVRYRDVDKTQSALVRTNRQKLFMKAVSERAREMNTQDTDFIVKMNENLKPYIVTNIGKDVMVDLLKAKFDSETGVVDLPGDGVEGERYDEYHIDELEVYELVLQMFYEEV
ncbi:MAG: LCP family protein [Tyzzerella sp.]|nr:LCP family protein [Tyzzerella sp.]